MKPGVTEEKSGDAEASGGLLSWRDDPEKSGA